MTITYHPALGPGIHDISPEQYHADPCSTPSLSSSLARIIITRSPKHAWAAHPRLNPDQEQQDTSVFDIGRAAHRAVLGKGGDYVAYPDELLATNGAASTKAAKEWAAEQRDQGRTPLKPSDHTGVMRMAESVRASLQAMNITLDPSRSELTAIAEIDGVMCRAMIDNAPIDPRIPLRDLKTTMDASPDAIIRSIARYGYDVQAAHYRDVWFAATGEKRRFQFIFIEKLDPYGVSVVELVDDPDDESDWFVDAGAKCAEARRIWGKCLAENNWPGYPTQIALVGAPVWHRRNWAENEANTVENENGE